MNGRLLGSRGLWLIQPYQISFLCQRFILGGQIVDSSAIAAVVSYGESRRVGTREERSGCHQFAPFVADGRIPELSSIKERERGERERERERGGGGEMNYHSSIDILL